MYLTWPFTQQSNKAKKQHSSNKAASDMSRPFRVVFHGSNQVVADQLDVFVEDTLPDDKVRELANKLFKVRLQKLDDVNDANKIDYATRAGWLQESLVPLMNCEWHAVRAFAGQHELTLKPHQWSRYFSAYNGNALSTSGQDEEDAEPFSDASIADAWTYLQNTANVQIAVTKYSADDCVIGLLKLYPCTRTPFLWKGLSEKQKSSPRILREFILTGKLGNQIFEEAAKRLRPVFKENDEAVACFISELVAKSGAAALLNRPQPVFLYAVGNRNGGGGNSAPWKPQRILGNVFSDVCHNELSAGNYTRNDVLERARVCGDVLALHDSKFLDDVEIMTAALESSFEHLLPSTFGCRNTLTDDKAFMMTAFKKNIENLNKASKT